MEYENGSSDSYDLLWKNDSVGGDGEMSLFFKEKSAYISISIEEYIEFYDSYMGEKMGHMIVTQEDIEEMQQAVVQDRTTHSYYRKTVRFRTYMRREARNNRRYFVPLQGKEVSKYKRKEVKKKKSKEWI